MLIQTLFYRMFNQLLKRQKSENRMMNTIGKSKSICHKENSLYNKEVQKTNQETQDRKKLRKIIKC